MTPWLSAASAVVVLGLVGVIAAYLWVVGTMVRRMASVLSEQVAPGAQAVAGHVSGMAPSIRSLESAINEL